METNDMNELEQLIQVGEKIQTGYKKKEMSKNSSSFTSSNSVDKSTFEISSSLLDRDNNSQATFDDYCVDPSGLNEFNHLQR